MRALTLLGLLTGLIPVCGQRAGEEDGCAPPVEEVPRWCVGTFPAYPPTFLDCEVSEETYWRVVSRWFDGQSAGQPVLESLLLEQGPVNGRTLFDAIMWPHLVNVDCGKLMCRNIKSLFAAGPLVTV